MTTKALKNCEYCNKRFYRKNAKYCCTGCRDDAVLLRAEEKKQLEKKALNIVIPVPKPVKIKMGSSANDFGKWHDLYDEMGIGKI